MFRGGGGDASPCGGQLIFSMAVTLTPGHKRDHAAQADSRWGKVQVKLEGEDEYEALDKFERLEVFQDHIR